MLNGDRARARVNGTFFMLRILARSRCKGKKGVSPLILMKMLRMRMWM